MELARWAGTVTAISKNDLLRFHRIFLPFDSSKPLLLFFQMFLLRSIKAYLCPNMIDFHGVDFSECRSEEVIAPFDAQCIWD